MNTSEIVALQQPLSNEARVLYSLCLRPDADPQTGLSAPISNRIVLDLINSKHEVLKRGRDVNRLVNELVQAGLVSIPDDTNDNLSLQGKSVILPLLAVDTHSYKDMHLDWQPMQIQWQPIAQLYSELSALVGLIDSNYSQQELGDFKAYWLGRPQTSCTPFQWTQKLVFFMKKRRTAFDRGSIVQVGTQTVKPEAGVTADSNAKALVEKYSGKHKRQTQ